MSSGLIGEVHSVCKDLLKASLKLADHLGHELPDWESPPVERPTFTLTLETLGPLWWPLECRTDNGKGVAAGSMTAPGSSLLNETC